VPFFALLLAILQLGVVMIAQEVLQTATSQAARLIMTGQAQKSGMTGAQFQANVCTDATALFNCNAIYVNVQTFSSFSGISMTNPVANGVFNSGSLQYKPRWRWRHRRRPDVLSVAGPRVRVGLLQCRESEQRQSRACRHCGIPKRTF